MLNIGIPGLVLIVFITLIIFGPNKLPELGSAVGKTFREFKKTSKDLTSFDENIGDNNR